MILSMSWKAKCCLSIDYIEVKLQSGKTVSLNWDESEYGHDADNNEWNGVYKGVYFGEQYANGRLAELKNAQVVAAQIYCNEEYQEEEVCFELKSVTAEEFSQEIELSISDSLELVIEEY